MHNKYYLISEQIKLSLFVALFSLVLLFSNPVSAQQNENQTVVEEENKKIITELYSGGVSMNELNQILPEQFESNSPYVTGDEEDEYKEIHQNFTAAFPDAKPTIDVILASGELVAVLTSWNATHQNEFLGFPPTGKNIQWKEADVYRMSNGKILEHWNVADGTNLYTGIGLLTVANSTGIK